MSKKELIEMLSNVPDNARILTTYESYNLISNNMMRTSEIKGFYEFNGSFVLTAVNVRPGPIEQHD